MTNIEKMTSFILANANPSIRYRVCTEVLGEVVPEKEKRQLQEEILREKIVKLISLKQQENGWIGLGFHGSNKYAGQYDNQEVGTKYLGEKGLKGSAVLDRAMKAFENPDWTGFCEKLRPKSKGRNTIEFNPPAFGVDTIRCACIARAGYADKIDVSSQIRVALESFNRVLEVDSVKDISHTIRGGKVWVFNDGERWPCRYHLDILAHTDSWKTEENIKMLADSIAKMMRKEDPELMALVPSCWVGHTVGAIGGFPSQGLAIKAQAFYPAPITVDLGLPEYYNIEYLEWLARCGVVRYIPALKDAVEEIEESIDESGICRLPVMDGQFKGWSPYFGLQLEADWRSKTRRDCDITFRSLLIMHYANQS